MSSVESCDAEFSDKWGAGFGPLNLSCLDTSRSKDTNTTSEEGSKSLISRSPKNCSACFNPPSRALLKYRFFCFLRDAIRFSSSPSSKIFCKGTAIEFIKKALEMDRTGPALRDRYCLTFGP
jgi:hypothetical protein